MRGSTEGGTGSMKAAMAGFLKLPGQSNFPRRRMIFPFLSAQKRQRGISAQGAQLLHGVDQF